jgi:hypothetical protein
VAAPTTPVQGGAICPAGFYCPTGSSSPIPCDAGFFNANTGRWDTTLHCTQCPAGSFCNQAGATAVSGPCPVGFFCPAGTVNNQTICPVGHYCPVGSGTAIPCAAADYQDLQGQAVCKVCPAGFTCTDSARTLCRPDIDNPSYYCPSG